MFYVYRSSLFIVAYCCGLVQEEGEILGDFFPIENALCGLYSSINSLRRTDLA